MQNKISCTFMRAGTSRGPFLDLRELPTSEDERARLLLKIMGSPDKKQIDGIGGATPVTSKVVMVQPSERPGIDVDYLFAQVFIEKAIVDTKPTCGNMMTGVAPFAIEKGWVEAQESETKVRIYNFNTKSEIEVLVQTPDRQVNYITGEAQIDGVPGKGAPIWMSLFGVSGGATGQLFPTGNRTDFIEDVPVSIVDAGNLMMLVAASSLGLNGQEDATFFTSSKDLMARIERLRQKAGELAGLGDVSESVLPKVGILSQARAGGTIKSQYLTPHKLHPTHAVSGAVCIGTACRAVGTVVEPLAILDEANPNAITIEHPSGKIPVRIETEGQGETFDIRVAQTLRTARKLMDGFVYY